MNLGPFVRSSFCLSPCLQVFLDMSHLFSLNLSMAVRAYVGLSVKEPDFLGKSRLGKNDYKCQK